MNAQLLEQFGDLVIALKARGVSGVTIVANLMHVAAMQAMADGAGEEQFAEAARFTFRRVQSAVTT